MEENQQETPNVKYEYYDVFDYKVVDLVRPSAKWEQETFNKLGQEGWELVTIEQGFAYFKRKLIPV